jgi:hypothetical protein
MKITDNSLCSMVVWEDFRNFHIKHSFNLLEKGKLSDIQHSTMLSKVLFYQEKGFRMLVFSQKSNENLNNYMIPKEIRLDVLRSLPNRKDVIQIDEHNCIKYIKDDERLSFITCFRKSKESQLAKTREQYVSNDMMIHTHFFSVDLKSGEMGFDSTDTYDMSSVEDIKTLIEKYYSRFLVVVTYLELTDVTLNIVEGSLSKNKNKKSNLSISNKSRYNVIHVNTNWNTMVINVNSFGVRGHWRLQSVGVGRSQYKYVWVKPYEKGLTRRLPQKELVG